uniref:HSF_DOMAIN domain-containing protein n=1 Tax=Schistocephalus solidus TaxID=70667 RepID=A0A183SBC9_SCHSO
LGTSGDGEDMEFSHPFFIRGNDALLTRIHRKPPSYTFSNNLLSNQLLTGSPPVPSTGLNQNTAAARANRVILGGEFNRLADIVKQMRARQEWTTHQLHLLFNFFSAIATESRPSNIRIGAVKRKLALPEPSDSNKKKNQVDTSKVIYSLADPTRMAAESPFQELLFTHPSGNSSDVQSNSDTVGNSSDIIARYSLPRVRLLSQDVLSTGQVLSHTQSITSAPILSIREVPQSGSSPLTDASPGSPTTSRDKIICASSDTNAVAKAAGSQNVDVIRRILPKSVSTRAFSTNSHSNVILQQPRSISPSVVVNLADMMDPKVSL